MGQNTTAQKGRCINFGNCSKANDHEDIEINLGDDFICPDCHEDLMVPPPNVGFSPYIKWIVIIAGILLVLGVVGYFGYKFIADRDKPSNTEIIEQEEQETEHSYPITPDGIILDKTFLEFEDVDTCEQLTATVFPSDVPENNKTVIWRSGDETVATVDSTGLVTAVAYGNAVISAYTRNGLSATCYVTVGEYEDEAVIEVAGITLDKTSLSLNKGMTDSLTAKIEPSDATDIKVYWTSDNPATATVGQTGIVTAVAEGKANIIVIAADGKTDTCAVTVNNSSGIGGRSSSSGGSSRSTISFPSGSYTGELKNGIPDGRGTMSYSRSVRIARHARDPYCAEAGDTFVGLWGNGDIESGELRDRNNNVKVVILAGKRPNPYNIANDGPCE